MKPLSRSKFENCIAGIDQRLRPLGYVRHPENETPPRAEKFEYLTAEWENDRAGLTLRINYGLDLEEGFHTINVVLYSSDGKRINLGTAAVQIDPSLWDVFRAGRPEVPEEAFLQHFGDGFTSRAIPALNNLLTGRQWMEVPDAWDPYR